MLREYIKEFTKAARDSGIGRLKYYMEESDTRTVSVYKGEIEKLERSEQRLLFIEGEVDGFSGSVFVENFQPELRAEHIRLIRESALEGMRRFVSWNLPDLPDLPEVEQSPLALPQLADRLSAAEKAAYAQDRRVDQVNGCTIMEKRGTVTLENESGRSVTDRISGGRFYIELTAREGEFARVGERSLPFQWGKYPDLVELARQTAADTAAKLDAASYRTGTSPVILDSRVVCELLNAFLPSFFAKNVQNHMSVLEGRLGERVAGACITLEEEPQLPGGLCRRRFDDEGVPTSAKTILSAGVLKTYLYNRQSAFQAGRAPGGNGFKPGYGEEPSTGYTNIMLRCGESSGEKLLEEMGDGLLINGVSGVFAGAHPASGEFSLIAQGYKVSRGELCGSVSQITIAGNFFELLQHVQSIGCDTGWMQTAAGCVCAPSLYVSALAVSGGESE